MNLFFLKKQTWPSGIQTNYTYDTFGLLLSTTSSDSTPSITNTYNTIGQLTTVNDIKGSTTFIYDSYGMQISENINDI